MNQFKAATNKTELKIGADLIVIEIVKGNKNLYRILINNSFKGYVEHNNGEYSLTDGSNIHSLIFARITNCIKNGLCI